MGEVNDFTRDHLCISPDGNEPLLSIHTQQYVISRVRGEDASLVTADNVLVKCMPSRTKELIENSRSEASRKGMPPFSPIKICGKDDLRC